MRRLIYILCIMMGMSFSSCGAVDVAYNVNGVVYDGITYYEYYMDDYYYNDIPVILVNGIYYYQYWDINRHLWWREPIPSVLWHNVIVTVSHHYTLGGYWCDRYPWNFNYRRPEFYHRGPVGPGVDRPYNGGGHHPSGSNPGGYSNGRRPGGSQPNTHSGGQSGRQPNAGGGQPHNNGNNTAPRRSYQGGQPQSHGSMSSHQSRPAGGYSGGQMSPRSGGFSGGGHGNGGRR